jgi:hypothetical protein
MTTRSTSHIALKSRDTSVMAGIDKHFTASVTLDGTAYTPAELKALFQSQVTALEACEALRKSLSDAVVNAKAVGAKVNSAFLLLRGGLIMQYGKNANAVLNDFGMTVPKTAGPRTIEAKALAAAKSKATRAARHTMGAVQKKAVTGQVVGVTVTPITRGPLVTGADSLPSDQRPAG